ncbi:uncharacterized protein BT62DRAFT_1014033 [Guyanagaster necrorhizus]|uniref:Uncharacterized protein n=1 Tax=Guyanagaster necrorhizus TaxID=856835 RepID=A0A9P7VF07_9AGAR|nr:uncharacterized protein BT62DRAFT_1014033 [Guyanagaster necrorhizus MCA 3950]KAG7439358.1 hypothetical protein BT62DRAFT_1014033 [Guyanagaster necrorhizus MCA 3950]
MPTRPYYPVQALLLLRVKEGAMTGFALQSSGSVPKLWVSQKVSATITGFTNGFFDVQTKKLSSSESQMLRWLPSRRLENPLFDLVVTGPSMELRRANMKTGTPGAAWSVLLQAVSREPRVDAVMMLSSRCKQPLSLWDKGSAPDLHLSSSSCPSSIHF